MMKKKLLLTVVALFTAYLCTWAQSGTCGENLTWKIENGVLTISGTGEMSNYYPENGDDRHGPWNDYLEAFTSIVVEEGVTAIGEYGFAKCSNITSASLPSTLTKIHWCAFEDCKNLTTLEIPSSVTHIGAYAFDGCEKLVEKENYIRYVGNWAVGTTDNSLTTYTLRENAIGLIDRLFYECTELNSIELPENLKYIMGSFAGCSNLESITIPASVKKLEHTAFLACYGLKSFRCLSTTPPILGSTEVFFTEGSKKLDAILYVPSANAYSEWLPYFNIIVGEDNTVLGICGENLTWKIENGVLTISGTGEMYDYYPENGDDRHGPWNDYLEAFTSIVVEEGVTAIGQYGFAKCSNITSASLPSTLINIDWCAFEDCKNLTTLEIPSSVTHIGAYAFDGCDKLVQVENNIHYVGNWAVGVSDQSLSTYSFRNNTIGIAGRFCCNNNNIVSFQFPEGIKYLGTDVLWGCSNLESVTLPSSIEIVSDAAISGNPKLVKATCLSRTFRPEFPHSFNEINLNAVLYVYEPTKYTLWAESFGGGIKALNDDEGQLYVNGIYYTINEDGASVSVTYGPDGEGTYSGNVTVPASVSIGGKTYSVTGIGENAFKGCSSLTSVTLPEGLKTIGHRGFDVCTSLESINFPSTLTSIGDHAFALCAALKGEIALPAGVTSLPIGAFAYCESITSLTLPSTFKTIGIETFLNCKSLETVNLPNGLTGIGESAFSVCGKLVSITLPQSLTDLGGNVFSGCSSLKSIAIPSGVKVIGRDAFASCTSLETVSLSEGLTEIGVNAFLDCKSLTSVTIPASVTKVGDQAFKMCEALLKVALPDALATIGNYVFAACLNLKEVNIPSSLKQLPEGMFHDCCALEEVVIPASSTAIGINTFHNCQSLKNVALPAGLTKIGSCAFEWSGLTSVDIPEAVTQIDEKAFSGCSALADVTVSWKEPISINENVFAESMKETLHVPSGTQSAYQQATGWMDFENIVSDDTEPEPEPETENAFAINDTKVMAGSVFTMPVELKNSCEVAAFQCDIYLPEGITLQKNNKGKYEISLDENRKDDHTITIAEQPDGAIRIVVASLSSSTFSGTEGTLFNMELLVAEDVSGEKSVAIKNIHISEADGKRHELADADATVSIQTYTPADANNDGMIAIDDVVLTINAVLGNTSENFVFDAADMNGDGQILIDDVVKVINAVLGVNTSAASNARRADINESFILNHTESGLGMSVSNAAGYAALQYDLQLPEGAEVTDVRFTGKSNHKVTFREMDGNVVRVIVVSLTNEAFSGNELLDVMIDSAQDAEISIENACVATRNGAVSKVQNASAKIGGNATAIDQLLDGMARADVYDLNGKLVKKNAATAAGLQKGVYIINGKKITIK